MDAFSIHIQPLVLKTWTYLNHYKYGDEKS